MKIGITTFHRAHNYGATLQSYALSRFITQQGHEAFIIDYNPNYFGGYTKHSLWHWLSLNPVRAIRKIITEPFLYSIRGKRWEKFECFINSLPLYSYDRFKDACEFDLVLYGSDQIWNPIVTGGDLDDVLWGIHSRGKSVSYAASLGEYVPNPSDKVRIGEYLTDFYAISVRETNAKNILSDCTNKQIEVVCDPVFLLSAAEWNNVLPSICEDKPYVLCYNLLESDECEECAKNISNALGIQLIEISGKLKPHLKGKWRQSLGPLEFVSYIKNAEFVVTSSFHGTAFSIIFRRPFYSVGMGGKSERVKSLLNQLKLENQLIESSKQSAKSDIYNDATLLCLKNYISSSKGFLTAILNPNER